VADAGRASDDRGDMHGRRESAIGSACSDTGQLTSPRASVMKSGAAVERLLAERR
jgi:hypothetical protein